MTGEPSFWPEDEAAMRAAAFAFDLKQLERRFLDEQQRWELVAFLHAQFDRCPKLALPGRGDQHWQSLVIGHDRTWRGRAPTAALDP